MSDYIIIALLTLAVYYPLRWGAGGDDVHLAAPPIALLAVGVGAVDAAVRAVRQGGV